MTFYLLILVGEVYYGWKYQWREAALSEHAVARAPIASLPVSGNHVAKTATPEPPHREVLNLVENPDFEEAFAHWQLQMMDGDQSGVAKGALGQDRSYAKLVPLASGLRWAQMQTSLKDKLKPSQQVRVQLRMRVEPEGASARGVLRLLAIQAYPYLAVGELRQVLVLDGQWRVYAFELEVPEGDTWPGHDYDAMVIGIESASSDFEAFCVDGIRVTVLPENGD